MLSGSSSFYPFWKTGQDLKDFHSHLVNQWHEDVGIIICDIDLRSYLNCSFNIVSPIVGAVEVHSLRAFLHIHDWVYFFSSLNWTNYGWGKHQKGMNLWLPIIAHESMQYYMFSVHFKKVNLTILVPVLSIYLNVSVIL